MLKKSIPFSVLNSSGLPYMISSFFVFCLSLDWKPQAMPSCLCSGPCLFSAEVRKVGSASLVYKDLVVAEGSPLVRFNFCLYTLR
jgi:hypothetical protein